MEPKEYEKNLINETATQAANFIRSVYLTIIVDTLYLRPTLHFNNFNQLHFTPRH
jgi:hypothetical protein